mmetsp:Transcript_940/g.2026  ORF Transcript_940/g.2026 Transcript_940/m.2026 type:complete len:105 (+) Transcript_940:1370-1684(+)
MFLPSSLSRAFNSSGISEGRRGPGARAAAPPSLMGNDGVVADAIDDARSSGDPPAAAPGVWRSLAVSRGDLGDASARLRAVGDREAVNRGEEEGITDGPTADGE